MCFASMMSKTKGQKEGLLFSFSEDSRFSNRLSFLLYLALFLFMLGGVWIGAFVSSSFHLFSEGSLRFLLFSGIPSPEEGFFSCFATLLVNTVLWLVLVSLLGFSAFGVAAVPVALFLRGCTVGMGVFSFLTTDGYHGLWRSACCFLPGVALSCFFLVLFSLQAIFLSYKLAKFGFSSQEGNLYLKRFWKSIASFFCISVVISATGAFPALLYGVLCS